MVNPLGFLLRYSHINQLLPTCRFLHLKRLCRHAPPTSHDWTDDHATGGGPVPCHGGSGGARAGASEKWRCAWAGSNLATGAIGT